tara:strand:- start:99 stop:1235 length:1137 start_codon:yes stop_codon:yes gene_type:complete
MTKARELAKLGEVLTNSQIGGRRNIAYNGAMQISQRGTQTGQGGGEAMSAVDRFKVFGGGGTSGRLTSSQDSDAPVGFANSLKLDCTTADTSIASGEFLLLEQRIEGQDLQQLKYNQSTAQTTTLSFYVKGNASAQYTFALQYHLSGGTARWFTKGFAVTTSWTQVTIEIPGDTQASSGSDYGIADNNGTGANIMFWLHGGTNFSSGTHQDTAWADRDYTKLFQDNQTSFYDSTDRTFFITGVQFEIGKATPFEHRSFGEELILCKRYTEVFRWDDTTNALMVFGYWTSTTTSEHVLYSQVEMRTVPSFSFSNATDFDVLEPQTAFRDTTAISTNERSRFSTKFTATSGSTAGFGDGRRSALLRADTTNAFMMFDAEL